MPAHRNKNNNNNRQGKDYYKDTALNNSYSTRSETKTKPFILIGDSSPFILNHLASIFELANFSVRTAKTAQECIDIFMGTKDRVDIVLLDGAIAGEEGVNVILNIRRAKRDQKIMVIVEQNNVRAAAMRVGADVVEMKPITPEAILQKVNDMLIEKTSFMERKRAKFERRRTPTQNSSYALMS